MIGRIEGWNRRKVNLLIDRDQQVVGHGLALQPSLGRKWREGWGIR